MRVVRPINKYAQVRVENAIARVKALQEKNLKKN